MPDDDHASATPSCRSLEEDRISYFLGKVGIITHNTLRKGRRYAVTAILILAAVITPPDVFSQFMLAGPLYFLYEVSILVVKFTGKKKTVEEDSEVEG